MMYKYPKSYLLSESFTAPAREMGQHRKRKKSLIPVGFDWTHNLHKRSAFLCQLNYKASSEMVVGNEDDN